MAKQFFKNLPDTSTPLTAPRLNGLLDGDESMGDLVVESIKSKNVFNPSTVFNGYINTSNNTIEFETSGDRYSGFAKVSPNTTYTISKAAGYSFRIATTTNSPRNGVAINQTSANHTGTSITITTGANDNYLVVFFYSSSNGDTGGYTAMADTIQVEIGSSVSTYISYNAYGSSNLKDEDIVVGSIRTKNMFNKNTVTYNSAFNQDGTIDTSGTYFSISDYIEVEPSTQYTYSGITVPGTLPYSIYLDSNKNFISSFKQQTGVNTITTPSNAKYVRFSIAVTVRDIDTFQLEKGSTATLYSPYQNLDGKDTVILTNGTLGNYFSTVDSNLVAKSGNVVQIQFRALVSTTIPNNGTFYTVPYRPRFGSANEILIGVGGEYDYNTGIKWGYVDRSGALRGESIAAGKWIHINTTFITED